jgi:hypothetical protein
MASVRSLTKKPKKKTVSKGPRRGLKGLLAPSFDNWEKLDGANFHRLKINVSDFWYQNFKHNDTIEWAFEWMKDNGYSKTDINSVKKAAKHEQVLGIRCKMLLDGCPDYNEKEQDYWQACPGTSGDIRPMKEYIATKIEKYIEIGKDILEEKKVEDSKKKKVHVPTIQERLQEATIDKLEDMDGWLDDWMRNSKKNPLLKQNPLQYFKKHEMNLGHLRFVSEFFKGAYEEMQELNELPAPKKRDDMQEQLAEGYSSYSKKEIKELTDFYKRLFDAIEIVKAEKKQTRAIRKPKVKSAQELVKKLKFKSSDGDFGIASINPSDIIDATALVVFNTKNRKLGIYYAEDHTTFKVKGTTLQFFDETKSVQKTVRKPEEILPQWKKVTKHKLKTQFGYLKTTETKMNGRFNADTIILKAFK